MMADAEETVTGRVVRVRRYPVKSMLGEELDSSEVTPAGLVGDRAFALIDAETGKVVSAKNPKRWPNLFGFQAAYVEPPRDADALPPVRITSPDGPILTTDQADIEARLTAGVGRPVRLARTTAAAQGATAEGYWPDHDWLPQRDEVFDFTMPPGTFFDLAAVHLVTTATLDRLAALAPGSRFDVPRFRPNFVIETADGAPGFIEDGWIGRTVAVGDVLLRITGPCPRCVMTTLAQGDLPKDPAVLRAAVHGNSGNVGVYAEVVRGGTVRLGDAVAVL
jgi:uncharacterized protein YcbX